MFDERTKGLIMRSLDSCISGTYMGLLRVSRDEFVDKDGYSHLWCVYKTSKGKIKVVEKNDNYLFYIPISEVSVEGTRCWGDDSYGLGKYNSGYVHVTHYIVMKFGGSFDEHMYRRYLKDSGSFNSISEYLMYLIDFLDLDKRFTNSKDKLVDEAKDYARKMMGNDKVKIDIEVREGIKTDVLDKYGVSNCIPVFEVTKNVNYYVYEPEFGRKYVKYQIGRDNKLGDIIKVIRGIGNNVINEGFLNNVTKISVDGLTSYVTVSKKFLG